MLFSFDVAALTIAKGVYEQKYRVFPKKSDFRQHMMTGFSESALNF